MRKGIGEVSIIKSSKKYDLLWLQIKCKNVDLFVAAVYFCPEGSRRVTDGREQFLELEADILHFREKGKVICLGDFNARIGNQVSVIWTKEDQEDKMIYQRVSQDGKIQDRGRNFVDSMNSCNLVIMNGIDSKGEYTFCSHNRVGIIKLPASFNLFQYFRSPKSDRLHPLICFFRSVSRWSG